MVSSPSPTTMTSAPVLEEFVGVVGDLGAAQHDPRRAAAPGLSADEAHEGRKRVSSLVIKFV